MPGLITLRALSGFSTVSLPSQVSKNMAKTLPKATPLRFKGNLIDEVDKKDREMLAQIDTYACSKPLTRDQRHAYEAYLEQYQDLNDDLERGFDKKVVVGLLKRRMAEIWKTFTGPVAEQSAASKQKRNYSSPRLSQSQSTMPDPIDEE